MIDNLHITRNNPEQVEAIFSLMSETLWVASYDRRRENPLLADIERWARNAVRLSSGKNPSPTPPVRRGRCCSPRNFSW